MIGVFDSGVGGLSVWKELVSILPGEKYIYLADSGYCPYGPRSAEYVIERAARISDFFLERGAEMIVVACNTATAAAIDYLRGHYNVPFVGMEPAVKPAAIRSASGTIGVLATKGTFSGDLYHRTLSKFASGTKVIEQIGTGLVELVESCNTESAETMELLGRYLEPMLEQGADQLVLGCTHYPFLIKPIKKIVGERMDIVNPAPAIALHAKNLLEKIRNGNYSSSGGTEFYTTGDNEEIVERLARLMVEEGKLPFIGEIKCRKINV